MTRKGNSLKRRQPFREPLPSLLILTEGLVTETGYFEELKRLLKLHLVCVIRIEGGVGVPKTMVDKAAKYTEEYQEVWCVFDIDEHPNIADAVQKAQARKLKLAISNPCFELWLLLHFREQRGFIHRKKLADELRKFLPGYQKKIPEGALRDKERDVIQRAEDLERMHERAGRTSPKEKNPGTGVHQLVQRLLGFGRDARLQQLA